MITEEELRAALTAHLDVLIGPHLNRNAFECIGNAAHECDSCADVEGLVPAAKALQVELPAWAASIEHVRVSVPPLEEHRHKYCPVCWRRDPRLPSGGLLEELKEFYAESSIGMLVEHPILRLLGRPR